MVLQLTDFTSEITDEELREFTSEYYIPSALHPVVPAARASIADFPEGKLADAQAEAKSSRSYAQKLAEEKMALLVKNNHFAGLDEFRQRVKELLEKQEEKLRKLSIEYDEELYPHMLSAIAER
ncbi:hypothetical protein Tco_1511008, partial [Tanacetum coccineum]